MALNTVVALLDEISALSKPLMATLDDVAAGAVLAGKKSASVIIDDAAVTPKYVTGFEAEREIPIIRKIAMGSLKNKLLFLWPAAILLNYFAPWLIVPLLIIGGLYLVFEGAEKVFEMVGGVHHKAEQMDEDKTVASAIKTDFILSAEIMVIALSVVADKPLLNQITALFVIAVGVTVLVYGAVAIIVKLDDFGLYLIENDTAAWLGQGILKVVPPFLKLLAIVGTLAMLSVGGGLVNHSLHHYHIDFLYKAFHAIEYAVAPIPAGITEFSLNTMLGLLLGSPIAFVMHKVNGH